MDEDTHAASEGGRRQTGKGYKVTLKQPVRQEASLRLGGTHLSLGNHARIHERKQLQQNAVHRGGRGSGWRCRNARASVSSRGGEHDLGLLQGPDDLQRKHGNDCAT